MRLNTNSYNYGDRIRCRGQIKDIAGTLVSPSPKIGWYKAPGATIITQPTVVTESTGNYYFDVDATVAGMYLYGFYATGSIMAASPDGVFWVQRSARQ